jgi:proline iminopeptidase
MLGLDYYLKYPKGIKGIIFASPCLSIPLWQRDAGTLIKTLPDSIQKVIKINEANKTFDSPAYQSAIEVYYEHFLSINKNPSIDKENAGKNIGLQTYQTMWGPSEFNASGNLKNYDKTADLHTLKIPVLFICGEFDEAIPGTVKYYSSLVPDAKFEVVKNAAHLTMIDNPSENNRIIRRYLQQWEKR